MNVVSLLYFFSFIVYIYLGCYVISLNSKSALNRVFLCFCLSMSVWAFTLGFMIAAPGPEEALFWRRLGAVGGCLFPALYLHFAFLLTNTGKKWVYPLIYSPALVFLFDRLRPGGSISEAGLVQAQWGWDYIREISLWHYAYDIYFFSCMIIGALLVYLWGRRSTHAHEKNQSWLIIVTIAITLIFGIITDVFFPYMNVVFPQLGVVFLLIHSYGIWLAITKYRMMTLTPAFVVGDILKTMNDPVIVFDKDGFAKISNLAAQHKLGYSKEELDTLTKNDLFAKNPGTPEPAEKELQVHYEHNGESELLTRDGKKIPVSYSCSVIKDEAGESTGIVYVLHDITQRKRNENALQKAYGELEKRVQERTAELDELNKSLLFEIAERKQAEEKLRKSEEHFRQIVELLPVAVVILDQEEIVFANTSAAELVNAESAQEFDRKSFTEYLHPDEQDSFFNQLQQVKSSEKQIKTYAKIVSKLNTAVDAELIMTPFEYQGSQTVLIVVYDLTRRKKMEEEIMKTDKLESIGMLAGGIAHDFNNYLATLLGNISMIRVNRYKPEKVQEKLDNMEKATLRAKELTHQLFVFAKGGAPVKKTVSVSNVIKDITSFALSGSGVRSHISIAENLDTVEIDEGQISQVLNNIIINAVQSMPDGGNIWVSADNIVIETDSKEHLVPLPEGDYVRITVSDEGVGIPREYLSKIFDPFFTTKPKGSGLGLATSYSIVKNHGGYLTVESEEGVGTTFYLYLPTSERGRLSRPKNNNIIYGSGRVLVMDDEKSVREITGEMLSALGYDTRFARDGKEAIEIYMNAKENGHPFDLVLMDLTIPGGMGGRSTVKKLLELDPGVRAVVFSGYSDDPVMANFKEYGFKGVIKKPFTTEELSNAVYEAIR